MSANSFGQILRLTSFGESHGQAIGGILDGFPANISISLSDIQAELDKRKPAQIGIGSNRQENDQIEILSGIFQGKSLGSPIAFLIRNTDARSQDYEALQNLYRPGHADDTYSAKYIHRDHRGGGRASARQTAVWVAAGAFAKILLNAKGIDIKAYTEQIGDCKLEIPYTDLDLTHIYTDRLRCPQETKSLEMQNLLKQTAKDGDSLGGVILGLIQNAPQNLGEPIFDKLHARLGMAMLSIPACRGFEFGCGFKAASMKGSEHNDLWLGKSTQTLHNYAGGIRGGISTGEDIYFRLAFKPIASIGKTQKLLSSTGDLIDYSLSGRHDICCVPRAVPIVEALSALVIADFLLLQQCSRITNTHTNAH
ncbi:MAG: chorismate synthase [Bacteroidales bacterium]